MKIISLSLILLCLFLLQIVSIFANENCQGCNNKNNCLDDCTLYDNGNAAYIGGWDKCQGYARGVDKCDPGGWCAIYFPGSGACYLGKDC